MATSFSVTRPDGARLERVRSLAASLRKHLPITLLFVLLTIIMTYPLITYVGKGIMGWEGDGLYYVWQMWWVKHSVIDLHLSPFFDPLVYFPVGYQVANGELTPANSLLLLPITALWGPVVGYNVAMLFSFFASALGAYLWIYQVTKRQAGACVGAVIFAFLPYRFAHMAGHLELMSTQWIPLTFFAVERFIANRRLWWAVATGLFLALVALSSWYYAYAAMLLFPVYLLLRTWPWHVHWREPRWRAGVAIIVIVALMLVIPFAVPYYRLAATGQIKRDLGQMEFWTLNPYDFFLPNLSHPLWSKDLGRLFPVQSSQFVERQINLGWVALTLAIAGWWRTRRSSWTRLLVALWVISYLLALGPTLHSADKRIQLPFLPAIPLPSYILWRWVPFTSGMRVMIRFGLWTGLVTGALAGLGASELFDSLQTHLRSSRVVPSVVVGTITVLILFESYGMIYQETPLQPRPVDQWLAAQSPCSSVIELPLEQGTRSLQNYYATVNQQCTVLGPAGDSFDAPIRSQRIAALRDFPSADSLAVLKEAQTKYVLFTPSQITNWHEYQQAIEASNALYLEQKIGNVWVYRVK
jgi:hypothetical protein